jgi:very-short-patch-repair endonuclease
MRLRSREGELLFLAIVREAGLSRPLVNVPMIRNGVAYEADFVWLELRLVVEIDGPQHDGPEHVHADRIRDGNFFVDDFDVLRISTERMKTHRAWCRDLVRRAHERQRQRFAHAA